MTDDHTTSSVEPAPTRRSATVRLVLLGLLVVGLLAAAGTVVWLLTERRGEAQEVQADRETVMAQAEQFMLRVETYGPDSLDAEGRLSGYRDAVAEVTTPKYLTDFEKSLEYREVLVKQQGAGQTVEVLGRGVEALDDDSATVLVSGEVAITQTTDGGETKELDRPLFRVVVKLVKVDGDWLVDDSEVASEAGS